MRRGWMIGMRPEQFLVLMLVFVACFAFKMATQPGDFTRWEIPKGLGGLVLQLALRVVFSCRRIGIDDDGNTVEDDE